MDKLKYSKSHEWFNSETKKLGITQFAVGHLGDVVEVELPEVGDKFAKGDEIGTVESTKTASPLYTPLSGTITAINEEIEDSPELVNDSPYKDGWLFAIELSDESELKDLMGEDDYKTLCAQEDDE
jgi:glycine cleavage system H protein